MRFFNRNNYFALPDGPINQPICECHDYGGTLSLYDTLFGKDIDTIPELIDMTILSKEELAPGIMLYKFPKESAHILKGLIQNAMFKQWKLAEVHGKSGPEVNYDARNVSNYFFTGVEANCHPHDPIRRVYDSLEAGIKNIVLDFRGRYNITELDSAHWVLLRYEINNQFHYHIDDAQQYPRVISSSIFLNDDFEGGELEFKEFGLKIKPEAGSIVLFCSAFPYMHKVHPITRGVRYAVVKWYCFKQM